MSDFSEEELAAFSAQFKQVKEKAEIESYEMPWTPDWHFHEQSKMWVEGARPFDGCSICDEQYALIEKAKKHPKFKSNPISFAFTEEALERITKRLKDGLPAFEVHPEYLEKNVDFVLEKDYSNPTKDDRARWRKQFSRMIQQIRTMKPEITEDEDSMRDAPPETGYQASVFGVGPKIDKKRKK